MPRAGLSSVPNPNVVKQPDAPQSWTARNRARVRAERLAEIDRQVKSGELIIRQATAEEAERYGIGGR